MSVRAVVVTTIIAVTLLLPFAVTEVFECMDYTKLTNTTKCDTTDHVRFDEGYENRCVYQKNIDDGVERSFCGGVMPTEKDWEGKCVRTIRKYTDEDVEVLRYVCACDRCNVAEACNESIDASEAKNHPSKGCGAETTPKSGAAEPETPGLGTTSTNTGANCNPNMFLSLVSAIFGNLFLS